jgi:signal transduction histidine kinase
MRSLALKLTLAFLLVGLTGALLIAGLVRFGTQREFDRLVLDQNQQQIAARLTAYYQLNGSWQGVESLFQARLPDFPNSGIDPRGEARRILFLLADADGRVIFSGSPLFRNRTLSKAQLKQGLELTAGGETAGWLVFTPAVDRWRNDTPEGQFLLTVNRGITLSALAGISVALVLGGILAYTLTRTLRELTTATQALTAGELGRQVPVRSRDELGVLASAFNQMSSRLAQSVQLRRQMTADIAHDLRTPLSVIQGYSEALADGKLHPSPEMLQVIHDETRHLSRLVEDLRTLSLADSGELPLLKQEIDPAELLQRLGKAYRGQAQAKNIDLQVQAQTGLALLQVDVERMMQVLGNLVSNALRYTPANGAITLAMRKTAEFVELVVSDSGSGIPPEDLPFIFERSFRGEKARQQDGATGLGLSIAKSLVDAQGGHIRVDSRPGEGTAFTISLPAT